MRTGLSFGGRLAVILATSIATVALAATASAQQPVPVAPPPGFAPPPPGFAPPPAGYAQPGYPQPGYPPGYAPPAPGYAPPGYYAPPLVYGPPPAIGPKVLDWDEGQPVPAGYHLETKTRKGLAIAGGVMFGTFYLFSAFGAAVASDSNDSHAWPFWVPAIGPFIALGTESGHRSGEGQSTVTFLYVLDGLVQTGGLAMLVGGIAFPSTRLVRNDVALFNDKVHVKASPVALGRGQYGFGFVGTM